jgi:hypothetical protein
LRVPQQWNDTEKIRGVDVARGITAIRGVDVARGIAALASRDKKINNQ